MVTVTGSNLQQVVEHLKNKQKISLDTETTGLLWTDRLFAITISDENEDYFFDQDILPLWDVSELSPERLVLKNAKFDMRMLINSGFKLPSAKITEDITTQARILKNDFYGKKAYSLENLALREGMEKSSAVDQYIKEHELYEIRTTRTGRSKKHKRFDRVPRNILAEYACKDSRLTYDLSTIYDSRMDDYDRKVFKNECEIIPAIFDIEMRGINTDQEYIKHGYDHDQSKLETKKRHFSQTTGEEYLNSKEQFLRIFEKAGEKIHKTDKGNPTMDDDVLQSYTCREAKIVQAIRFYEKRISTYWAPYIDLADESGYIHSTLWADGTRTGRFSSSDPNLQNIPKEEPEGELELRKCFVPDPGHCFVSLDYSQQEYRMLLDYAKEYKLIEKVMNGLDVHQATADELKLARFYAKELNFTLLYGAGLPTIAEKLGTTVREASILREKYFKALPKVESLIWSVKEKARAKGFIRNWFGRRLRFSKTEYYSAPNGLIQGGCGDVLKVAVNKLEKDLAPFKTRITSLIHDQIVFDVPPEELKIIPDLKNTMENIYPSVTKIKLNTDVSHSWKSLAESDMVKGLPNVGR